MKLPNTQTIAKRIYGYAYKAGFTLHPQADGSYSLFDIGTGCYLYKNISMGDVVRIVENGLYAKA